MTSPYDALYQARWRAVGRRFLRQRPWIVAAGVLGNAILLAMSNAPRAQMQTLVTWFGALTALFFFEARALRKRELHETWLLLSLVVTVLAIGFGCFLSGALESPLLPLLFAPLSIGFAAFGAQRSARVLAAAAIVELAALALLQPAAPWTPIAAPQRGWITGWSALITVALVHAGIIGLVEAYRSLSEALERMRTEVIDQAARHASESENLGAKVAHEIRNPLTAIKGLLQLMAPKQVEERARRRHAVIAEEIGQIERVLDNYLALARPLSELSIERIDLGELFASIAILIEGRAAESGVRVSVHGDGHSAMADPRRLREAMLNLCQNALEAMPSGGELSLSAERSEGSVRITVADTGRGMEPELIARVGTQFIGERAGGTGLGLAIAQNVARRHGGDLFLTSAPNAGTKVTIELKEGT